MYFLKQLTDRIIMRMIRLVEPKKAEFKIERFFLVMIELIRHGNLLAKNDKSQIKYFQMFFLYFDPQC